MGRQGLPKESEGPVYKLVNRGKGLCGVREDSDCSAEVFVDPVVGTNGVLKGQDQIRTSGRHMDSLGTEGGKKRVRETTWEGGEKG